MHTHELSKSKLPCCSIDCGDCGSFVWQPPKSYFEDLFFKNREAMTQLIEATGVASLRIIKAAISGLYCQDRGELTKNIFKEILELLLVSVDKGLRKITELAPDDAESWVKTGEHGLFFENHCDFCGDIKWTPPKAIRDIDSEKMKNLLSGVGQMIHALIDLTVCLLRFNQIKSTFTPQLKKAVAIITIFDSIELEGERNLFLIIKGNTFDPSLN